MPELIEGEATRVPNATPQERFDALSPEQKADAAKQVADMQSDVADKLLTLKGWDLIKELYAMVLQKNLATSAFVVPVMKNKDAILAVLHDPVGFQKSFQTLVADLNLCTHTVLALGKAHLNKTGMPTDAELPEVFRLSNEYNTLISNFEVTIEPLMYSLIDVVRDQYGPNLEVSFEQEPAK